MTPEEYGEKVHFEYQRLHILRRRELEIAETRDRLDAEMTTIRETQDEIRDRIEELNKALYTDAAETRV